MGGTARKNRKNGGTVFLFFVLISTFDINIFEKLLEKYLFQLISNKKFIFELLNELFHRKSSKRNFYRTFSFALCKNL